MKYQFKLYTNNIKWAQNHLKIIQKYVYLFNLVVNSQIHFNNTTRTKFSVRLAWSSAQVNRINTTTIIRSPHIYKKSKESFSIISQFLIIFLSINNFEMLFGVTSYHIYQIFVIQIYKFLSNNNKIVNHKSYNKTFLF